MKSKHLALWLSAIGAVFLAPRLLWVAGSGGRLNDADARIALRPLKRIHGRRRLGSLAYEGHGHLAGLETRRRRGRLPHGALSGRSRCRASRFLRQ
jgi:hypothetical protein